MGIYRSSWHNWHNIDFSDFVRNNPEATIVICVIALLFVLILPKLGKYIDTKSCNLNEQTIKIIKLCASFIIAGIIFFGLVNLPFG